MYVNTIALKKIIGERVQVEGIINIDVDLGYLDSTVHLDACGALKKEETKQSDAHVADLLRKSIQSLRQIEPR